MVWFKDHEELQEELFGPEETARINGAIPQYVAGPARTHSYRGTTPAETNVIGADGHCWVYKHTSAGLERRRIDDPEWHLVTADQKLTPDELMAAKIAFEDR